MWDSHHVYKLGQTTAGGAAGGDEKHTEGPWLSQPSKLMSGQVTNATSQQSLLVLEQPLGQPTES